MMVSAVAQSEGVRGVKFHHFLDIGGAFSIDQMLQPFTMLTFSTNKQFTFDPSFCPLHTSPPDVLHNPGLVDVVHQGEVDFYRPLEVSDRRCVGRRCASHCFTHWWLPLWLGRFRQGDVHFSQDHCPSPPILYPISLQWSEHGSKGLQFPTKQTKSSRAPKGQCWVCKG